MLFIKAYNEGELSLIPMRRVEAIIKADKERYEDRSEDETGWIVEANGIVYDVCGPEEDPLERVVDIYFGRLPGHAYWHSELAGPQGKGDGEKKA